MSSIKQIAHFLISDWRRDLDPEMIQNIIGMYNDLLTNIQDVGSNTGMIWSVIAIQHLYGRAREINARSETREEVAIQERERDDLKHSIREYCLEFEAQLWSGLDHVHSALITGGVKNVMVHMGNDILQKSFSDLRRDYHHGFGKEHETISQELFKDIISLINSDETDEKAVEILDEISRQRRNKYLRNIHKRTGYCTEITDMEEKFLPYEFVRGIVLKIYENAQKRRILRHREEKELEKKYSLNLLSIIKIARVLLRRGKK